MSENEKVSYHIDAQGETELSPRAYKEAILKYRFEYSDEQLSALTDDELDRQYRELTE